MNNKKKQTIEQTPESNEREVTLLTSDRELEDFLIVTYPHAITEEQHKVHKELNCKIFEFSRLKLNQVEPFLRTHAPLHEYEIRDSKTGEIIRTNGDSYSADRYKKISAHKKSSSK